MPCGHCGLWIIKIFIAPVVNLCLNCLALRVASTDLQLSLASMRRHPICNFHPPSHNEICLLSSSLVFLVLLSCNWAAWEGSTLDQFGPGTCVHWCPPYSYERHERNQTCQGSNLAQTAQNDEFEALSLANHFKSCFPTHAFLYHFVPSPSPSRSVVQVKSASSVKQNIRFC